MASLRETANRTHHVVVGSAGPYRDAVANFGMQAEVMCRAHRPDRVAHAIRHDVLDGISDVDEKLDVVDQLRFKATPEVAVQGDPNEVINDLDCESLRRWPQVSDVVLDFCERGLRSPDII